MHRFYRFSYFRAICDVGRRFIRTIVTLERFQIIVAGMLVASRESCDNRFIGTLNYVSITQDAQVGRTNDDEHQ